MMHPHIRKGFEVLLMISGAVFAFLSILTAIGILLILANGGAV